MDNQMTFDALSLLEDHLGFWLRFAPKHASGGCGTGWRHRALLLASG